MPLTPSSPAAPALPLCLRVEVAGWGREGARRQRTKKSAAGKGYLQCFSLQILCFSAPTFLTFPVGCAPVTAIPFFGSDDSFFFPSVFIKTSLTCLIPVGLISKFSGFLLGNFFCHHEVATAKSTMWEGQKTQLFYQRNSKEGELGIRYVGEKRGGAVITDYINKITAKSSMNPQFSIIQLQYLSVFHSFCFNYSFQQILFIPLFCGEF